MPIASLKNIANGFLRSGTDFLEELFPVIDETSPAKRHPGYTFVRHLNYPHSRSVARVTEWVSAEKERIVVKSIVHRFSGSAYQILKNEARLFEEMGKLKRGQYFKDKKVRLPRLVHMSDKDGFFSYAMEYVSGRTIDQLSISEQLSLVSHVIRGLRDMTPFLKSFGFRRLSFLQCVLTFPFYWLKAVLREPKLLGTWMRLAFLFYKFAPSLRHARLVLTHYDLNRNNLRYADGVVTILDFGRVEFAPEEMEPAVATCHYWEEAGVDATREWLESLLPTVEKKNRFLAMSAYVWIQRFTIVGKRTPTYTAYLDYIRFFLHNVISRLM